MQGEEDVFSNPDPGSEVEEDVDKPIKDIPNLTLEDLGLGGASALAPAPKPLLPPLTRQMTDLSTPAARKARERDLFAEYQELAQAKADAEMGWKIRYSESPRRQEIRQTP